LPASIFREATDPPRPTFCIGRAGRAEGWAFADVFYDTHSPTHQADLALAVLPQSDQALEDWVRR
jgi:hypothetical protein